MTQYKPGDVVVMEDENNQAVDNIFQVYEITGQEAPFEKPKDGEQFYVAYHILDYEAEHDAVHVQQYIGFATKPTIDTFKKDGSLFALHIPFHPEALDGGDVIGSVEPANDDMNGYYEYLKENDFDVYVEKTGKDAKEEHNKSIDAYQKGLESQDKNDIEGAIEHFAQAIDLYPLEIIFYEAIGYALMEIKDYDQAIQFLDQGLDFAAEDDPHGYALCAALGLALHHAGEKEAALEMIQTAMENTRKIHKDTVTEMKTILEESKSA